MSQKISKIVCIIAMWGLLIYVGYNVLTVEAAEYDKDEWVSGVTPDEWSDAEKYSDDTREMNKDYCAQEDYYDKNEKFCDKLAKGEDDIIYADEQPTVEATSDQEIKDVCKKMDGEWKKGECKFEDGVEMGKPYSKEQYQVDFDHYIYDKGLDEAIAAEEKAAKEDAICDDEDADTTNVKLCMSDKREKQLKNEREWYYNENTGSYEYMTDKEIKDHNLESESGIMQGEKWGPETPIEPPSEPYPTTEQEVIEDWGNTVTDNESIDQQKYFEARAESNADSPSINDIEDSESEEQQEEDEPEQDEEEESNDDESEESSDSNENEEDNSSE